MKRARAVELSYGFDDALDKDPLPYKFKIEFEKNTSASKDTHLDNIMSCYNGLMKNS